MSLLGELRRRNVLSIGGAYIVGAWLLIEAASVLGPAMDLPRLAVNYVTFIAILGFPVALVMAWAYELTPDGVRPATKATPNQKLVYTTGRKLDFIVIGTLALLVGFLLVDDYLPAGDSSNVSGAAAISPSGTQIAVEEELGTIINSVAVLPFDNLSPDPAHAYFSAGIHESILSQLAGLSNLSVIARTSVMQYADSAPPIPDIAAALRVETIMEGSVRYDGDRILVTAQLVDGVTGSHLWAAEYPGDLSDVFAIQADIAMNIANALEAEFSPEEQESIERIPTDSSEAYALYLKALAGSNSWQAELDQAISLDRDFALAYALKAQRYAYNGRFVDSVEELEDWERMARDAAETALTLDPTLGFTHVALGILHETAGNVEEANRSFQQAYELSPRDRIVLEWYARFKRHVGQYAEAIRVGQEALKLDPNDWYLYHQLAVTHRYAEDYDASASFARRAIQLDATRASARVGLAIAEAVRGNDIQAVTQLQIAEELGGNVSNFRIGQMALTYSQAGRPDEAQRLFNDLKTRATDSIVSDSLWAKAYLALGNYDEVFRRLESAIDDTVPTDIVMLAQVKANGWRDPVMQEDARFVELRDRIKLL